MNPRDNGHVRDFKASLEAWTDHRFVSSDQVYALAMFSLYLVNIAEAGDWSYYGHSFKVGKPLSVLVIKATINERPVVCFTSARSFCSCVAIFLRKDEMGLVEWRDDQYRQ